MDARENFEQQLLLFNAIAIAHLVRCADASGALDGDAKDSLAAHLSNLSKAAEATGADGVAVWMDMLVQTLPPLPRRGS